MTCRRTEAEGMETSPRQRVWRLWRAEPANLSRHANLPPISTRRACIYEKTCWSAVHYSTAKNSALPRTKRPHSQGTPFWHDHRSNPPLAVKPVSLLQNNRRISQRGSKGPSRAVQTHRQIVRRDAKLVSDGRRLVIANIH